MLEARRPYRILCPGASMDIWGNCYEDLSYITWFMRSCNFTLTCSIAFAISLLTSCSHCTTAQMVEDEAMANCKIKCGWYIATKSNILQ